MNYYFLGVTTGQSAMNRIMPEWGKILGFDLRLIGVDCPIGASAEHYTDFALRMREDKNAVGAVVTTHKLSLFKHARQMFDEIDDISILTSEIATIAKRDGRIFGAASADSRSVSLTLKSMLDNQSVSLADRDVVCFGAGGVGRSIILALLFDVLADHSLSTRRPMTPASIKVIESSREQINSFKEFLHKLNLTDHVDVQHNDSTTSFNDRAVCNAKPNSMLINATGMGKDLPGSPTSASAVFPERALVWDLNYRGDLQFLHHARSQAKEKKLFLFDGWTCFLHGWTQSLQNALNIDVGPKFEALSSRAAELR